MNNNNLILTVLLIFSLSCATCLDATFEISKSYLNDRSITNLGTLKIIEEAQTNIAEIEPFETVFVSQQEIQNHGTIILTFRETKSKKQFKTAVTNNYHQKKNSEKIVIVLSSSNQVIGFNYVRTKEVSGQIRAQIHEPNRGVEHIFKIQTQTKQVVQQESFFSKYKWYLIIGGVVLYMTMNADPQKLQQAQQKSQ